MISNCASVSLNYATLMSPCFVACCPQYAAVILTVRMRIVRARNASTHQASCSLRISNHLQQLPSEAEIS